MGKKSNKKKASKEQPESKLIYNEVDPHKFEREMTLVYLQLKGEFSPQKIAKNADCTDSNEVTLPSVKDVGSLSLDIPPSLSVDCASAAVPEINGSQTIKIEITEFSPLKTPRYDVDSDFNIQQPSFSISLHTIDAQTKPDATKEIAKPDLSVFRDKCIVHPQGKMELNANALSLHVDSMDDDSFSIIPATLSDKVQSNESIFASFRVDNPYKISIDALNINSDIDDNTSELVMKETARIKAASTGISFEAKPHCISYDGLAINLSATKRVAEGLVAVSADCNVLLPPNSIDTSISVGKTSIVQYEANPISHALKTDYANRVSFAATELEDSVLNSETRIDEKRINAEMMGVKPPSIDTSCLQIKPSYNKLRLDTDFPKNMKVPSKEITVENTEHLAIEMVDTPDVYPTVSQIRLRPVFMPVELRSNTISWHNDTELKSFINRGLYCQAEHLSITPRSTFAIEHEFYFPIETRGDIKVEPRVMQAGFLLHHKSVGAIQMPETKTRVKADVISAIRKDNPKVDIQWFNATNYENIRESIEAEYMNSPVQFAPPSIKPVDRASSDYDGISNEMSRITEVPCIDSIVTETESVLDYFRETQSL